MHYLKLLIVFNIIAFASFAQTDSIPYYEQLLNISKGEERVKIYHRLSRFSLDSSLELSLNYAEEAEKLLRRKYPNDSIEADIAYIQGEAYYYLLEYKRAVRSYISALDKSEGRFFSRSDLMNINYKIGSSYKNIDKLTKATDYYRNSLEYAKQLDITEMILRIYIELYTLFNTRGKHKEATQYYRLYHKLHTETNKQKEDSIKTVEQKTEISNLKRVYEKEQAKSRAELSELDSALNVSKEQMEVLLQAAKNKEKEIELLNYEKLLKERAYDMQKQQLKIKQKEIKQKQTILILLIVVMVIVSVFSLLFYRQYLQKRKANINLTKSEANLKELNATKDKFFSIIAHDLKNPLHVLLLTSDLLKRNFNKYDDEKKLRYIQNIFISAKNLSDLLENLLKWSRSQLGRVSFKPAEEQLFPLVEETIKVLKPQADKKEIELKVYVNENFIAYIDKDMITTVIRNLTSNAIKFTKQNGTVEINAFDNDKSIKIIIKDTGIGISEENLIKLFRLDVHHTTKGTDNENGTGLGLILCKEFVERHGGKIHAESEIGKGSSFIFTVPKQQDEA